VNPRTIVATAGGFHFFNMARQLEKRGLLSQLFTGYPSFKLRHLPLPKGKVFSFPFWRAPYLVHDVVGQPSRRLEAGLEFLSAKKFDEWTARRLGDADVFVGMSSSSLFSLREAKRKGMKVVCDRGCSHIQYQSDIIQEEFRMWNLGHFSVDPRIIKRETQEYAEADIIFVPSDFSWRSFVQLGVPESKLRLIPYGVDVSAFYPDSERDPEAFTVLFAGQMSLRKGIPYLFEAYRKLDHPNKRLLLAGTVRREVREMMETMAMRDDVEILGPVNQPRLRRLMSESDVLVLPSVEDGFGLVMAEGMACGTPVISTENTGGSNLYADGVEGYIVPIRSAQALHDRLQRLADDPALRQRMSEAAMDRVQQMGGWDQYGEQVSLELRNLVAEGKVMEAQL